jgi:succinyl-CoA synthetase alpha subunit
MDHILVRRDSYHDSVFLMSLSARLREMASLVAGHVVLATPANRELLSRDGFDARELAALGPTDLVIALRAETEPTLREAGRLVEALLSSAAQPGGGGTAAERPVGFEEAWARLPHANLALISVPGTYAAYEAAKALERGLHVMIFSDNVPLEDEIALKRRAAELGLLVMGPGCGTALVNGKPLGFANRVRRGNIGLVGASGTGLQEVACQIHRFGGGVSHILGTGGRDLCAEVGGITTLAAIDELVADAETHVIGVVSKPPAPEVAARVIDRLRELSKRSMVFFLGDAPREDRDPVHAARDLTHAAWLACHLAAGQAITDDPAPEPGPDPTVLAARLTPRHTYLHGLFVGGTLATEALLALRAQGLVVASNLDHGAAPPSEGHTVIDLGDDAFTQGRPHPMIEPGLRAEWITRLGRDPRTALLLLDVVLGSGCHPDPAAVTGAAISEARRENPGLVVLSSVTGTDLDAQGLAHERAALEEAGSVVLPSNVAAARLAGRIVQMEGRRWVARS